MTSDGIARAAASPLLVLTRVVAGGRPEKLSVLAVIVLFLAIGLAYSLVVPPFESPDELQHYAFARHLAQGQGLPIQTAPAAGAWAQEGSQPPLYYALVGWLTAGIDQSDFSAISRLNPYANLGNPLFAGNKNRMLYSARTPPLRGANLALHVGRWFSLLLACGTLWLTYLTARLTFPHSGTAPRLVLLIAASIPQFAFISASLSNDNLVTLLSTAVLFWLGRLVARDKTATIEWWEWLVLGGLLGLAALSKLQALGLFVLTALVIVGLAWFRRDRRQLIGALLLVLLPAVAIAGWWYVRNHTLYGDWLGLAPLKALNPARDKPLTLESLLTELAGVRYSFWGLFGWFNILLPDWIYKLLDALSLLALLGLLARYISARQRAEAGLMLEPTGRTHSLLGVWLAIMLTLMLYWTIVALGGQGRLVFPALSALAILLLAGLDFWLRRLPAAWRRLLALLLPAGLVACSVYALTTLLPWSYRPAPAVQAVPAGAQEVRLVYNDAVELLGVELPKGRFKPADEVAITLFLRARKALPADYPLYVHLLDQDNLPIGNVTTYPGWGRNPTTLWQPGEIYADQYQVKITGNVSNRSPLLAQVSVGFLDAATRQQLPVLSTTGDAAERTVGYFEVVSQQPLDLQYASLRPADATFGDVIRLAGYDYPPSLRLDDRRGLTVVLWWQAAGTPAVDYTAFVHLVDDQGKRVAGFDQAPAEGRFPTRYWRPADQSLSRFLVPLPSDLPAGTYQVWAGLYDPTSPDLPRLAVTASDLPERDNRVLLGSLQVR